MHGAEIKTAISLWWAGGLLIACAARPLLQTTPRTIAVPVIAIGALMIARGVWLLVQLRRYG